MKNWTTEWRGKIIINERGKRDFRRKRYNCLPRSPFLKQSYTSEGPNGKIAIQAENIQNYFNE